MTCFDKEGDFESFQFLATKFPSGTEKTLVSLQICDI